MHVRARRLAVKPAEPLTVIPCAIGGQAPAPASHAVAVRMPGSIEAEGDLVAAPVAPPAPDHHRRRHSKNRPPHGVCPPYLHDTPPASARRLVFQGQAVKAVPSRRWL